MAKITREEWNIQIDPNTNYNIKFDKNKISINGTEFQNIKNFKKINSNLLESAYEIPLPNNQTAILYINNKAKERLFLSYNNINVKTGQPYEMTIVPKWIYVFYVLYLLNIFIIIGGAVGGAIAGVGIWLTTLISTDKTKNNTLKVILSIGLYIGITTVSLALALAILNAFR